MPNSRELHQQITDLEELLNSAGWKLVEQDLKNSLAYYLDSIFQYQDTIMTAENKGKYLAVRDSINKPEYLLKQLRSKLDKELNNKSD